MLETSKEWAALSSYPMFVDMWPGWFCDFKQTQLAKAGVGKMEFVLLAVRRRKSGGPYPQLRLLAHTLSHTSSWFGGNSLHFWHFGSVGLKTTIPFGREEDWRLACLKRAMEDKLFEPYILGLNWRLMLLAAGWIFCYCVQVFGWHLLLLFWLKSEVSTRTQELFMTSTLNCSE